MRCALALLMLIHIGCQPPTKVSGPDEEKRELGHIEKLLKSSKPEDKIEGLKAARRQDMKPIAQQICKLMADADQNVATLASVTFREFDDELHGAAEQITYSDDLAANRLAMLKLERLGHRAAPVLPAVLRRIELIKGKYREGVVPETAEFAGTITHGLTFLRTVAPSHESNLRFAMTFFASNLPGIRATALESGAIFARAGTTMKKGFFAFFSG
jgi:hypothetical protein